LEFFLKHRHDERQLLKRWQQIADILPELTKVSIGYDYIEMILHYTLYATTIFFAVVRHISLPVWR
jgi:hypothetical protein